MPEAAVDQGQVLDFLASREAYDPVPGEVARIETHASVVFLAGECAYKVKRAVKYPFLDFSTLDLRRRACLNELAINRRTAPRLYLDVLPVVQGAEGRLRIGGEGEPVEWILKMRRFDQASLYEPLAERGELALEAMPALAKVIADFHRSADRKLAAAPAVTRLQGVLDDNDASFAGVKGIPPELLSRLNAGQRDALAALVPLLAARALGGYVRHCHGDLHLRNIVEIEGAPVLFDAIEFDDAIATIDVLYDLAFLLMDLGVRRLDTHANLLINAYLDEAGDTGNLLGLAALPLFLSMRAMIRAKVELLRGKLAEEPRSTEAQGRAISYLSFAQDRLLPRKARLIAIGGLSGSGKSSVARALAPSLGGTPARWSFKATASGSVCSGRGPMTTCRSTPIGKRCQTLSIACCANGRLWRSALDAPSSSTPSMPSLRSGRRSPKRPKGPVQPSTASGSKPLPRRWSIE
jgi:aminoglycoside phosphotransferase family enzyme